ncbi:ATP synthase subunit I [Salicibibacter cibarius]|uniref:ATP synthase subunit I n=2 Tax=Salicibibacter cibarius TaxID=2743000 RepID=A0A7T6Z6N5_9BACI|nr:ATP synthase subunit I [Salicibibacter cibarius]
MKLYCLVTMVAALISILVFILTPYYSLSLGFLLGVVSCLLSFASIYIKAFVFDKVAERESPGILSYLVTAFGLVIRYGLIAVAVALAIVFSETFHLATVLAGYAGLYLYIMVDMFLQLQKER